MKRTHRNSLGPNVGAAIMGALSKGVSAEPMIKVVTNADVIELLPASQPSDSPMGVSGVAYSLSEPGAAKPTGTRLELRAHAVILATGGFGAAAERLAAWAPTYADFPTTNSATASGEGLAMALSAGASPVDLDQVQIHPTALVDPSNPTARTKWLAPEALRGSGGVLLTPSGRRFVDELQTRDHVSAAICAQPGRRAILVLGASAAAAFGVETLRFYAKKGLALELVGFHALAEHLVGQTDAGEARPEPALVEEALRSEASEFDGAVHRGEDRFGKRVFPSPFGSAAGRGDGDGTESFFALTITPAVHYCMVRRPRPAPRVPEARSRALTLVAALSADARLSCAIAAPPILRPTFPPQFGCTGRRADRRRCSRARGACGRGGDGPHAHPRAICGGRGHRRRTRLEPARWQLAPGVRRVWPHRRPISR
jgi:hypothetical protein